MMRNNHFHFWPSVIAVRNPPYLNMAGKHPPNLDFRETEQHPSYRLLVDYEVFFAYTHAISSVCVNVYFYRIGIALF